MTLVRPAGAQPSPAPAPIEPNCRALRSLSLDHVLITDARIVQGDFRIPMMANENENRARLPQTIRGLPAFCHVAGVISSVSGSEVHFVAWFPVKGWDGRLHFLGNGGYGSEISWGNLAAMVRRGTAVAQTDTGHPGSDPDFGWGRPEAIVDWANRAVHEGIATTKAITAAFYGAPPQKAYFVGCSTGGQQGLTEAQRYPEDFDGIVIGDPANNRTNLNMSFLWNFLQNHPPGDATKTIVPAAKLPLIHQAAVAACDKLDGVVDGVLDPRVCKFDVAELDCAKYSGAACLTRQQIGVMHKMYQGPRNQRTGEQIYPAWTVGSEGMTGLNWSTYWANPLRPLEPQRNNYISLWAFDDPKWDFWKFDWDRDVDFVRSRTSAAIDSMSADLTAFKARGGKMIMYTGQEDPIVSANDVTAYYETVINMTGAKVGAKDRDARLKAVESFYRFFPIAGANHCRGGDGVSVPLSHGAMARDSKHDMVDAMHNWVEKESAPDSIIAARYQGGFSSTNWEDAPQGQLAYSRPLCPYPLFPRFKGGDNTKAENFVCAKSYG